MIIHKKQTTGKFRKTRCLKSCMKTIEVLDPHGQTYNLTAALW